MTQLLQENIPEMERGTENVQSSLNYLTGLIHVILVMLASRPQQLGMLVFISTLCVTTGHSRWFLYARKCKIKNAQVQQRGKMLQPERQAASLTAQSSRNTGPISVFPVISLHCSWGLACLVLLLHWRAIVSPFTFSQQH